MVKVASNPFEFAIVASANALLLAQGLTNKCDAPAEPTLSSFPAATYNVETKERPNVIF